MKNVEDFSEINMNNNVDMMDTIGYGFKKTFSNWKLWIISSLLLILVFGVLGGISSVISTNINDGTMSTGLNVIDFIPLLISFFISPIIIGLALHEIDYPETKISDFNKNINYVNCLIVTFILYVIVFAIIGIFSVISSATFLSPDSGISFMTIIGVMIGIMLVSLFASPFFMFITWFAADKKENDSIKESFIQGFNTGKKHYTTILLWYLTISILSFFATIFTLGFAVIIIMPASCISQAYLYRQLTNN